VRSATTAATAILVGLHLSRVGLAPSEIGAVVSAGLWGGAVSTALVAFFGERVGRRRMLALLALLASGGIAAVAAIDDVAVLTVVAFFGIVNGMGRDRGAQLAVEQAVLPSTTTDATRTRAFAVQAMLQDIGGACGSLAAALPVLWERTGAVGPAATSRSLLALSIVSLAGVVGALLLSPSVEVASERRTPLTPGSRRVVARLSGLFFLDATGGGLLTGALLSWFLHERFGVGALEIGALFAAAKVLNALSHLAAAWLARRIGLVNTMVFTHIPSSVLLATVGIAPTFPIAAALFLLREGLVEMDVPTRSSYLAAIVRPEERTSANAITSLVRLIGWAIGPLIAGVLAQHVAVAAPLAAAAALKITYDVALWISFRRLRPPEERPSPEAPPLPPA
jgi:MFS family permease